MADVAAEVSGSERRFRGQDVRRPAAWRDAVAGSMAAEVSAARSKPVADEDELAGAGALRERKEIADRPGR